MSRMVVAFDLYGTLLSTESIATELSKHFGQEKAKSVALVWRKYQLEYTWRLNSMRQSQSFLDVTRNSLHHALLEHGLDLDHDATERLMESYDSLSTFPDVEPALKRLTENPNVTCVVFSNGTKTMVTNSVTKSKDLSPYSSMFKDLVTVDFVRSFKPAPEVYHYLLQRVDMVNEANRVWLISGNPFDVVGARTIGMQAAWVDRSGIGWQDKLSEEPTVVIQSLEEVAGVVEKHAKSGV